MWSNPLYEPNAYTRGWRGLCIHKRERPPSISWRNESNWDRKMDVKPRYERWTITRWHILLLGRGNVVYRIAIVTGLKSISYLHTKEFSTTISICENVIHCYYTYRHAESIAFYLDKDPHKSRRTTWRRSISSPVHINYLRSQWSFIWTGRRSARESFPSSPSVKVVICHSR